MVTHPFEISLSGVEVSDQYQRVGSDAMLTCTGVGTDRNDLGYTFSWYYFDSDGDRNAADEGVGTFNFLIEFINKLVHFHSLTSEQGAL